MRRKWTALAASFSAACRLGLAAGLAFAALAAEAGVIASVPEQWDAGTQGWTGTNPAVTIDNPGGYLRITFPSDPAPPDPQLESDLIFTYSAPATNLFVGNYDSNRIHAVGMRFLASNVAPSRLQMRFGNAANLHEWSFLLSTPPVGQWASYRVPLDFSAGWMGLGEGGQGGLGAAEFLADLESVDWIGIYIQRTGMFQQEYGLDDFKLSAPEPSDYALLSAAVLGLLLVYRRHRRDSAALIG